MNAEHKTSGVYVMQASNGLVKIGKANNAEIRRMQLEQSANMFTQGERLTIRVIKFYPMFNETVAFALESHLHEVFADCSAGTSSREVFCVNVQEVVKVADTWAHAWGVAQSIILGELLLSRPTSLPK
jgi:hypothetical protein